MGIRNLNGFLCEKCSKKAIKKIHLKELMNKKVVIDTSIYLYKFSSEGVLMENMYLLISILIHYKIIPLFVFDGKPPPEKRELLKQRRIDKTIAEEKYLKLESKLFDLSNNRINENVQSEMKKLKRMFVRINDEEIKKVKSLMLSFGVSYCDASGEADQLCAFLVNNGNVWGCISDDTDMFLYGCNYVLRNINLSNHTITMYDTNKILEELKMSKQIFCEIMILSGTDYNIYSKTSLKETIKWYYEYLKYKQKHNENNENVFDNFYIWLIKNTKYIDNYEKLLDIYKIFNFNDFAFLNEWGNIEITNKEINKQELKCIMEKEDFIFNNL
jgi:hypothetical protein